MVTCLNLAIYSSKVIFINIATIDPKDGIYTYRDLDTNDILLESIEDRKSQVFVHEKDLVRLHLSFAK